MRALLVVNPRATATSRRLRAEIAALLAASVELRVETTEQRGHATHLAGCAVDDGWDAVFVLGGDGTANEVIQAVAGTGVVLGVIPGGGANVFARTLGLPNDARRAARLVLDALGRNRTRLIALGRAGERYFACNAGFGFDAAVVRHVEQHPISKRSLRQAAFVWAAAREWVLVARRQPADVMVTLPDGSGFGPVAISLIANADPYTYLGRRPMRAHPRASFDLGLDLLTIAAPSTRRLLALIADTFREGPVPGPADVTYRHDLPAFTLAAPTPRPLVVDGDYVGEHVTVTFRAVPDTLHVLG